MHCDNDRGLSPARALNGRTTHTHIQSCFRHSITVPTTQAVVFYATNLSRQKYRPYITRTLLVRQSGKGRYRTERIHLIIKLQLARRKLSQGLLRLAVIASKNTCATDPPMDGLIDLFCQRHDRRRVGHVGTQPTDERSNATDVAVVGRINRNIGRRGVLLKQCSADATPRPESSRSYSPTL